VSSLRGIMYLCIYVPPSPCDICIVQCSQQVLLYERKRGIKEEEKRRKLRPELPNFVHTYD